MEERGAGNCGAIEFIEFKESTSLESGGNESRERICWFAERERELSIFIVFVATFDRLLDSFFFRTIKFLPFCILFQSFHSIKVTRVVRSNFENTNRISMYIYIYPSWNCIF